MDRHGSSPGQQAHSCSTFMLEQGGELLVGHNLDEYIAIPGLVVVNKRGVAKVSTSWKALTAETYAPAAEPDCLEWRSKYGSLTYTTRGRECIDGGMNEAGLYIGEMTLMGTEYPEVPHAPGMYQVLWMQYLLDCFETVPEVLAHLAAVEIDGTCQWHFFVADRDGRAAVIEFLEREPVVHTGPTLPIPLLCNAAYRSELERLSRYDGFGGQALPDSADDPDLRFVWGARLLSEPGRADESGLDRAWRTLTRLQGESNRWGIIFDVRRRRMCFRTNEAPRPRFVDFGSFDFSPATPVLLLDINEDLAGDVAHRLEPYTRARNQEFLARFWNEVDGGEEFNRVTKPRVIANSGRFIDMLDAR